MSSAKAWSISILSALAAVCFGWGLYAMGHWSPVSSFVENLKWALSMALGSTQWLLGASLVSAAVAAWAVRRMVGSSGRAVSGAAAAALIPIATALVFALRSGLAVAGSPPPELPEIVHQHLVEDAIRESFRAAGIAALISAGLCVGFSLLFAAASSRDARRGAALPSLAWLAVPAAAVATTFVTLGASDRTAPIACAVAFAGAIVVSALRIGRAPLQVLAFGVLGTAGPAAALSASARELSVAVRGARPSLIESAQEQLIRADAFATWIALLCGAAAVAGLAAWALSRRGAAVAEQGSAPQM